MVFNDTRVIHARLFGVRCQVSGAREGKASETWNLKPGTSNIQVTLHKQVEDGVWKAFAKPARKLSVGDIFKVSEDFYAKILAKDEGEVTLEFNISGGDFFTLLDKYGVPPLPPYIERAGKQPIGSDFEDYQTIYAKNMGAVAAPTAGLHFTENLLKDIDDKGVSREFITLHVGAGTFLPMKVADTKDHIMHSEYGVITQESADRINAVKRAGGKVVAVGTTSLRLLESATGDDGIVRPFAGETDIFITPGYKFKIVDILVTNFHLPESTLFMLVSAFSGLDKIHAAYLHAIQKKYRFYSYGDACLLFRS